MEPLNYQQNFFLLLLLFTAIYCNKGIGTSSQNEFELKFVNLSKIKLSGIRNKSLYLNCNGQNEFNKQQPIKYNWLHNGQIIDENDQRFDISLNRTKLEIRRMYINIKNGSRSDGKYNCLISNSFGTLASRNIYVIPSRFKNISKKKFKKIIVGQNARLTCDNGLPIEDIWYSWKFNNEPLQETHSVYTLMNSSILHIINATKSNEGQYTCNAYNEDHVTSSKTLLKVDYPKNDFKYLKFLISNKTVVNAQFGQIITLECLINLARPDAYVTWHRYSNKKFFLSNYKKSFTEENISKLVKRKSRKKILSDNFDENIIEDFDAFKRYSIVGESNLQIENVNQEDEDIYFCTASYKLDELNITGHTIYRLNVLDLPIQVSSVKQNQIETFASKLVKFDCGIIYSLPKPNIKWLKNGLPIEINSRIYTKSDLRSVYIDENFDKDELVFKKKRLKIDDLINSQLVISNVSVNDTGYYQCFVDSKLGSLTNDFSLNVYPITNQPLAPKNIMVNVIGSSEAIVNWSVPMCFGEIFGYTIHFHGLNNKLAREVQKATNQNYIHLDNLYPYTNYSLYVRAYSEQSVSNDSEVYIFLTGEETPVDLPFFKAYVLNKTCVLLKWETLLPINSRGKILYYRIDYAKLGSNENNIKTINVEPYLNEYFICDLLQVGEKYKFKIIAGNSKGLPNEDIIENLNWEIVELPLINYDQVEIILNSSFITPYSIECNWNTYEVNNTEDISHHLKEVVLKYDENVYFENNYSIMLNSSQKTYNITNLNPNTLYHVEIILIFKNSDLKLSKKIEVQTMPKLFEPSLPDLSNLTISLNSTSILLQNNTHKKDFGYSSLDILNLNSDLSLKNSTDFNQQELFSQNNSTSSLENISNNNLLSLNNSSFSQLNNITFPKIDENIIKEKIIEKNSSEIVNIDNLNLITSSSNHSSTEVPIVLNQINKNFNLSLHEDNKKNSFLSSLNFNSLDKKFNLTSNLSYVDMEENEKNNLIDPLNVIESDLNPNLSEKYEKFYNLKELNNFNNHELNKSKIFNDLNVKNLNSSKLVVNLPTIFKVDDLKEKNNLDQDRQINKRKENISNELLINNKKTSKNLNNIDLEQIDDYLDKEEKKELTGDGLNSANDENKITLNLNETTFQSNEENLIHNLTDQDKALKVKLDNFMNSKLFNISNNFSLNLLPEKIDYNKSSILSPISNIDILGLNVKNEAKDSINFTDKLLKILNNNLTSTQDLLPSIYEFNVTAINSTSVLCNWKSNFMPEKVLYTIYYNPVHYLEPNNYQKNFEYEDDFLFIRTNETEIKITNLLPFTVYNFYINVNYKSEDEEDFFYQLYKFLNQKFKDKFYVKHSNVRKNNFFNETNEESLRTKQMLSNRKYNAQFKIVEVLFEQFDNLLDFYKGQRRCCRTLEDLPSSPTEFTGIALDANSIQLSWKMPDKLNGIITNYVLFYIKNSRQTTNLDEWHQIVLNSIDFSVIVKNLSASSEYKFIIKAVNGAGKGKQSTKLIIRTLQENYDTYEKFLTPEPDSNLNTFKYTKYEGITYKDIFLQDETNEILVRVGIGITCLFLCILMIGLCNKIITPSRPKRCDCKSFKKCKNSKDCRILQLNSIRFNNSKINHDHELISNESSYINHHFSSVQINSNLNQNLINHSNFVHETNESKSIQNETYCHSVEACDEFVQKLNRSNVKGIEVEVHNTHNSSLNNSNSLARAEARLSDVIETNSNSIEETENFDSSKNSSILSNNKNLNFQENQKNGSIYENCDENDSQRLLGNQANLNKEKFVRIMNLKKDFKKRTVLSNDRDDQNFDLPLLKEELKNIELIDQGYRLVPIIYENSSHHLIKNYTQSLNSNVRKAPFNFNKRAFDISNQNKCNTIETYNEGNLLGKENKRQSFV